MMLHVKMTRERIRLRIPARGLDIRVKLGFFYLEFCCISMIAWATDVRIAVMNAIHLDAPLSWSFFFHLNADHWTSSQHSSQRRDVQCR